MLFLAGATGTTMSRPDQPRAYIIAARRTAMGRVGGLHRTRRVEDLAAPVITAALTDAKLDGARVDDVIIGNTSAGGNPARLIALAAGLPERTPALTVDRQTASGLDAVLTGIRQIAAGDSDVVVAGGAESLSTAPWRIARPRNVYQTPRFLGADTPSPVESEVQWDAIEALAGRLGLSRAAQDAFALKSHMRADAARERRQYIGEIVALRANAEEAKDQSATAPTLDDLETVSAFLPPKGTLTPANTSLPHDGAAIVVIVSEGVWIELGRPPALRLVASASEGVDSDHEPAAPIAAMQKLYGRLNGFDRTQIGPIELGESSAAQALAFLRHFDLDEGILNPAGGALVRGTAPGAAGAVIVVRLFTDLLRRETRSQRYGAVVQGTTDGLGIAALFEAVRGEA